MIKEWGCLHSHYFAVNFYVLYLFCCIEAHSAHSDHRRTMWHGMYEYDRDVTVLLEEVDVARKNQTNLARAILQRPGQLVRIPPASGVAGGTGSPQPPGGGDTRCASYPVDDVHEARIT